MNNILIISIILLSLIGVYINSRLDFNKGSYHFKEEDDDDELKHLLQDLNIKSSSENVYFDHSKSSPESATLITPKSSRDKRKVPISRVPDYKFYGPGNSVLDAIDVLGPQPFGKSAKNITRYRKNNLSNKTGFILSTSDLARRDDYSYLKQPRRPSRVVSLHERQAETIKTRKYYND